MGSFPFWKVAAAIAVGGAGAIALWQLIVKLYPVLAILGTGLLIAYLLDPALDRLQRRGWSRGRAVWGVTVLAALVVMVVAGAVLPLLVGQLQGAAKHWPQHVAGVEALYTKALASISTTVERRFPNVAVMPFLDAKLENAGTWLAENVPRVLLWLSDKLARSLSVIGVSFLVAVVCFHFMMVIDPMREQLGGLLSVHDRAEAVQVDRQINVMLGQYLRGMALTCLVVAIANGLLLMLVGAFLGSEYGLLIGVLAGVGYFIPWLGTAGSSLTAAFLGYVTADHHVVIAALAGFGCVIVVNQLSDTFIQPRIVGRRVGLHPLVVILALLAGWALGGIWGMILATPTAAALKIVLCRWLPICEEPAEAPARRKHLRLDMGELARQIVALYRPLAGRIRSTVSGDQAEPAEAAPEAGQQAGQQAGDDLPG